MSREIAAYNSTLYFALKHILTIAEKIK